MLMVFTQTSITYSTTLPAPDTYLPGGDWQLPMMGATSIQMFEIDDRLVDADANLADVLPAWAKANEVLI